MPMKGLAGLLNLWGRRVPQRRPRLRLSAADMPIYAIGDVHGCLEQLLALEEKIVADARALPGAKLIVMLGDYIDRGPASAQVIDHLDAPPPAGFERICLAGNHEALMLAYLEERAALSQWLALGAEATLSSYGIDRDRLSRVYTQPRQVDALIRRTIPDAHAAFLRRLPVLVEAPGLAFVHAGFRPDLPLERQSDSQLVSIREAFYTRAHLLERTVVHGHTPISRPRLEGRRLNIDSGAYLGGPLTAVRIWRGEGLFLQSHASAPGVSSHSTRSP
ncbi:metallophosphoesterase [Chelativorans sp. M5D2P16]|uniref:metallophosphoesterase n=1 Tax=Chelativorans sp. M5D2P16 TaxID=3095678 RepID=UPI002ACAF5DA|nr:metallophosphoesterase [Chelativorans sp. M5D2P16]MDZ5696121.1 metallophosphoesterase [Chelativorans sp. M5D2P16]